MAIIKICGKYGAGEKLQVGLFLKNLWQLLKSMANIE